MTVPATTAGPAPSAPASAPPAAPAVPSTALTLACRLVAELSAVPTPPPVPQERSTTVRDAAHLDDLIDVALQAEGLPTSRDGDGDLPLGGPVPDSGVYVLSARGPLLTFGLLALVSLPKGGGSRALARVNAVNRRVAFARATVDEDVVAIRLDLRGDRFDERDFVCSLRAFLGLVRDVADEVRADVAPPLAPEPAPPVDGPTGMYL